MRRTTLSTFKDKGKGKGKCKTMRDRSEVDSAPPTKRRGKSAVELREIAANYVPPPMIFEAGTVVLMDCSANEPVSVRSRAVLQLLLAHEPESMPRGVVAIIFAPQTTAATAPSMTAAVKLRIVCGDCGRVNDRAPGMHSIKGRFLVSATQTTEAEDARVEIVRALLPRRATTKRLAVTGSEAFVQRVIEHCSEWRQVIALDQATDDALHVLPYSSKEEDDKKEDAYDAGSAMGTAQQRVAAWLQRTTKRGSGLPATTVALGNAISSLCTVQTRVGRIAASAIVERLVAAETVRFCSTCEFPTFVERMSSSSRSDEGADRIQQAMQKTLTWLQGHRNFSDIQNVRALRTHIAYLLVTERVSPSSVVDWLLSSKLIISEDPSSTTGGKFHVDNERLVALPIKPTHSIQDRAPSTSSSSSSVSIHQDEMKDVMTAEDMFADSFDQMWLTREIAAGIVQHGFATPTTLQQHTLLSVIHGLHSETHHLVVGGPKSGKTVIAVAAACNAVLARSKVCQAFLMVTDYRKAAEALELACSFTQQLGTECVLAKDVLQRTSTSTTPQLIIGTCCDIAELTSKALAYVILRIAVVDDADQVLSKPENAAAIAQIVSRTFNHTNCVQVVTLSSSDTTASLLHVFPISNVTIVD